MASEGRINNEPPQMNNEPIIDNKPIMDNEPAAQAQPEVQMGENKKLTRAERDALAQSWVEEQLAAEKTGEQVFVDLIAGGAKINNCLNNRKDDFLQAKLADNGLLLLNGYLGPRLSPKILEAGLKLRFDIPQVNEMKESNLCMVHYPRFTPEGEIDTTRSLILLLSQEQIQALQNLLSLLHVQEQVIKK